MEEPTRDIQQRVAATLRKRPTGWRRVQRGYTPAERWVVTFDDGSKCFVKVGTTPLTATWLRDEYERVYSRIEAPFLPRLLGWDDDPEQPILILEDLSEAFWPPPWTNARVEAVLSTLAAVREAPLGRLTSFADSIGDAVAWTWGMVELDPAPFLSLGLCSVEWLQYALPILLLATRSMRLDGEAVMHRDVRSDNICFVGDRAVLVDWPAVCRGNELKDLAFWAPSLHAEGGPPPEAILPDAPDLAAFTAGYFAARAGLPIIPDAPRVREVQYQQLSTALPWAARALNLPPLK